MTLARAVGMPVRHRRRPGLGMRSRSPMSSTYHRQKTGALFAGAAMMGAAACGADPAPWRALGEALGRGLSGRRRHRRCGIRRGDAGQAGRPRLALGRPSIVGPVRPAAARCSRFEHLVEEAIAAIPPCAGARTCRR